MPQVHYLSVCVTKRLPKTVVNKEEKNSCCKDRIIIYHLPLNRKLTLIHNVDKYYSLVHDTFAL